MRGATPTATAWMIWTMHFNPRAPCGARLRVGDALTVDGFISTHAPLAGRDDINNPVLSEAFAFQPTRPLRGATVLTSIAWTPRDISTHAPLAGRDENCWKQYHSLGVFQPTRPLRGATPPPTRLTPPVAFQPTRPLRGATPDQPQNLPMVLYFNPRAPCGARREAHG